MLPNEFTGLRARSVFPAELEAEFTWGDRVGEVLPLCLDWRFNGTAAAFLMVLLAFEGSLSLLSLLGVACCAFMTVVDRTGEVNRTGAGTLVLLGRLANDMVVCGVSRLNDGKADIFCVGLRLPDWWSRSRAL